MEYLLYRILSQIVKLQVLQCFVSFCANFMYGWRAQGFALVWFGKIYQNLLFGGFKTLTFDK